MKRKLIVLGGIVFTALFAMQPGKVFAADFAADRAGAWSTFKSLYIEAYKSYPAYGLVFDPSTGSNSQGNDSTDQAVSEGVGYGMLLAALQNDQTTFDKVFNAANKFMWNGTTYDWKVGPDGSKWGTNGATDADEDITLALIVADKLQVSGKWSANSSYASRAQVMINMIFSQETSASYLKPGNVFGGASEMNLSYFAPAWYRIFSSYETTKHDWQGVIDKQYSILNTTSQKYGGLIPDWQDQYGNQVNGSWGMRYDAIRVPWRIAVDSLANTNASAQQYLNTVLPAVIAKGGISQMKMYSIPSGSAIEYHNELSMGMWAAGAAGSTTVSSTDKQAINNELQSFYSTSGQAFNAQWEPAKWYYFNESLAMLGSAVVDGSFQSMLTGTVTATGSSGSTNNNNTTTDNGTTNSNSSSNTNSNTNSNTSSGSSSDNSGTGTSDTSTSPSNKPTYQKFGTVQHHHILVKVTQNNTTYIVRLYQHLNGRYTLFAKKLYGEIASLKNIKIHKNIIRIRHVNGLEKIYTFKAGLKVN